jgi:hypothetical protein
MGILAAALRCGKDWLLVGRDKRVRRPDFAVR